MKSASELFENTLSWLHDNYSNFRFFVERDVVWTVQTQIIRQINEGKLSYKIINDYPMLEGNRRSLSADLAILDSNDTVEVAVEFKYEPAHKRGGVDIPKQKLPVVAWSEVGKDVERIFEFTAKKKAKQAYVVFIDEGGYFSKRLPFPRSKWLEWMKESGLWVLYAHAVPSNG